jgi:glucan phosphoethanolaminetransferase (alkaline phosphatase superfamily)
LKFAGRLALDIALWCAAPAAFLLAYVCLYGAPGSAVLPHLRLILDALLAVALCRLVLAILLARAPRALRAASAVLLAAALTPLLLYYALVLVGLRSWGRVVSWELIASYGGQAFRFAEALGVPVPLALGALATGFLLALAAAWAYLGSFDWAPHAARSAPRGAVASALLLGSALCSVEAVNFHASPAGERGEPFGLTFRPADGAWNLQGHGVDRLRAARLDAREDAERAAYRPAVGGRRPNLVLIVVDAMRPDHMGVYGYARPTTPNLSRLERSGAMRKAASMRAACSASACGLMSIASSKYVHQFSRRPILLTEVLRRHGYRVHMVLSGDHTGFYGLREAYGAVDSYFDGRDAPKRYMNDDRLVVERLASLPPWDGEPVMFQLHLLAPHLLSGRDTARVPDAAARALFGASGAAAGPVERYDYALLQADATIAEILATLARNGYLNDAIVAVTADHGEGLGEHGLYSHTNSVYDAVLRVPFLLLSYGIAPGRPIDGHAVSSQVDIAPTLLAELGLRPPATWVGTPLQDAAPRDLIFFQQHALVGLIDRRAAPELWKYWIDARSGKEFAFNLRLDPAEERNLAGTLPAQQTREWRQLIGQGASMFVRPGDI